MKIRLVGAELFYADGQTDRHDAAIVAYRNFANAPKEKRNLVLCTVFSHSHSPVNTEGKSNLKTLLKLRLSVSLHIRSSPFAVPVRTLQSLIYTSSCSCPIIYSYSPVHGWPTPVGIFFHFREVELFVRFTVSVLFLWLRKKRDICVPHRILWDFKTKLLKIYTTGIFPGKTHRVGSLLPVLLLSRFSCHA